MREEKNAVVHQTEEQADPYRASHLDFALIEDAPVRAAVNASSTDHSAARTSRCPIPQRPSHNTRTGGCS